jgi:hypothetical protein
MWFSGYRTAQQFLRWNKDFYDGTLKPRDDLTLYMGGSQGFIAASNDTNMLLNVWDQCNLEAATRVQKQTPMVTYFVEYMKVKYGIDVDDDVLRQQVDYYWPEVNNALYGGCDRVCMATKSSSDWAKASPNACNCSSMLVRQMKKFAVFDPLTSSLKFPTPSTSQCLLQLMTERPITIFSLRAAIYFCFSATSLHTSNGLGWRPLTDDGYNPGSWAGRFLSFPEYLQPNYSNEKMKALGGMMQLRVLA